MRESAGDPTASLLVDAARRGARYRGDPGRRAVPPSPTAVADLARLDAPLPEAPTDPVAVLSQLDALVSPATTATAGPRSRGVELGIEAILRAARG